MYMLRNEAEVTLGGKPDFERMQEELASVLQEQPGFMGMTVLQSYGRPGLYTLTTRWTDRDAAEASSRSQRFGTFARDLQTSGLVRPLRMTEAYESVFEVDAENIDPSRIDSTCEVWIDWTLKSPALATAFEAYARTMTERLRSHAPGFVSARLRRFLGNDVRYLVIIILTDRAAARARNQVPQVAEILQAHPYTEFALQPATAETQYVVKRYLGAAAPQQAATAAAAR
jgi:heme-degrading monooxygenase HmoA